jgi:hypothetical protein
MLRATNHNHFTRHNIQFFEPDRIRNEVYKQLYGPKEEIETNPSNEGMKKVKPTLQFILNGSEKRKRSKYQRK